MWMAGFKHFRLILRSVKPLLQSCVSYSFLSLYLSTSTATFAYLRSDLCRWSKGEQSTAFATATDSSLRVRMMFSQLSNINSLYFLSIQFLICSLLQELADWNARYLQKFGFIFLICASGRTTAQILAELKVNHQLVKMNFSWYFPSFFFYLIRFHPNHFSADIHLSQPWNSYSFLLTLPNLFQNSCIQCHLVLYSAFFIIALCRDDMQTDPLLSLKSLPRSKWR